MKLIDRKHIDTEFWEERIAADETENVFCHAWYLDAVADDWMAVVTDDERIVVSACANQPRFIYWRTKVRVDERVTFDFGGVRSGERLL